MSKPVILLDAGELVALPGANDGDVLTWNGTTGAWQSSPGGGVGTVTSVALDTAATGLTVSGGTTQTITGAGTFTLGGTLGAGYGGTGLGAPAVGDAGKVLTATAGGGYELTTNGAGTVTSITAGTGLSGGEITTSGTISMPNVGTAGAYGSASSVPVITTDAQGRVSGVVPTSIAIAQSAVADLVSDLASKVPTTRQVIAGTGLSGGGALSGDVTLSLPSVGTQGIYGSASSVAVVTTDQQGRVSNAVTTAIAITQSQVADLVTDLGSKADKSVTATAGTGLTGGGTLGANFSFALDTVGTAQTGLGSASKTVTISTDAYGRVTSLSEQAISGLPASVITSGQLGLANGGTGIDASGVTGGQLLVGGTGALALQSVSGDGSLASTGALTVTRIQGNPITAGALGAPDAGKALVWSGSAWQATNIQGGGGGGGLTLYCNYAASSPYILDTAFDEHAQWDTGAITVANDAAGTELARFYTPTSFVIEVIPAGIWDINVYAQASGAANDTAVRAKVGVWNGSTLTILGTSDYTYLTDPSVLTQYQCSVYVPTTDLTTGDRIAVVLEGRRFAATTQTVTSYFGTGAISHVHSTLNAPGGTGLLKVVDGYLQSPASLLVNADVSDTAAIAVSKLAAGTDTYVLTTVLGVPTWSAAPATGVTSLTGTTDQVVVSAPTGSVTLSLPQSIGTGSSPTFAGLTLTGFDGLIKANPLTGALTSGAAVDAATEIIGTLGIDNGGTGLTASGASGNLLVSDGSAWASVAMSNDATIASTGALTLKNTGTAGTYGSASAVPVFVTDAQGRVTSVTNTNIAISASAITSGTLGVARGGTNNGSLSVAQGTVYYGDGTKLVGLAPGTAGQFLKTNGASANPEWASAGSGVSTLTGTAEQVLVGGMSGSPQTGDLTLSLPSTLRLPHGGGSFTVLTNEADTDGTAMYVIPGAVTTAGINGADLELSGGTGGASANGGFVDIYGGSPSSGNGNGGGAAISGGVGSGTGAAGIVYVGYFSTSEVYVGNSGVNTKMYGPLHTTASVAAEAGLRIPQGVAPTAPTNGDIWLTASGLYARINGATKQIAVVSEQPYDLSGEFVGTPASGATIMRFVAARAFTFGGTACFACTSNTGATAAVFTVNVNGAPRGTITIAGNATSGTGSITSTPVSAGALIDVVATTAAAVINPYWTLPGTV